MRYIGTQQGYNTPFSKKVHLILTIYNYVWLPYYTTFLLYVQVVLEIFPNFSMGHL